MKADKQTNAIKKFFKNDYHSIYLRSGAWAKREIKTVGRKVRNV